MPPGSVSEAPDQIVLKRHRDLAGRHHEAWIRRGLLLLLLVLPVLALANVFGQRPSTSRAASGAAELKVYAPTRVRGGLLYEARFHVTARRDLNAARLVLASNWLEGMTVNTIEPAPSQETSRNGDLELSLGSVQAGQSHLLFIQFQVNPTNVGHRSEDVTLFNGDAPVVSTHRAITVFP